MKTPLSCIVFACVWQKKDEESKEESLDLRPLPALFK